MSSALSGRFFRGERGDFMTVGDVILCVNMEKPNAYEEKTLFDWVSRLENTIRAEIMHGEAAELSYPDGMNAPLSAPAMFERIYAEYVFAMIDFQNQEYSAYQNEMEQFNESYDGLAKWYMRTHMPRRNEKIRYEGGEDEASEHTNDEPERETADD